MRDAIIFSLSVTAAFLGGLAAGHHDAAKIYKVEAVKRGHAAWVVQPDGSTVFVWAGEVKK
jgi:hypothetical protein